MRKLDHPTIEVRVVLRAPSVGFVISHQLPLPAIALAEPQTVGAVVALGNIADGEGSALEGKRCACLQPDHRAALELEHLAWFKRLERLVLALPCRQAPHCDLGLAALPLEVRHGTREAVGERGVGANG